MNIKKAKEWLFLAQSQRGDLKIINIKICELAD